MINLSPEICLKLKAARRAAKISQSELAAELGCKQSAISMFEQGEPTKLSSAVVEKLAARFGVELVTKRGEQQEEAPPPPVAVASAHTGYCPNAACPSNERYEVDGRARYLPDRAKADPVGGRFCAYCGELLERHCPNCGAPVHAGAICSFCGEPYIPNAV